MNHLVIRPKQIHAASAAGLKQVARGAVLLSGLLAQVSSAAPNATGLGATEHASLGAGVQAQVLTQVGLALIFIIALIVSGAWLMRRMGQFNRSADGAMKIISVLSLGSRERVVLVQVGSDRDHQLLLGVAPGRVTALHDFHGNPVVAAPNDNGGALVAGPFAAMVRTVRRAAATGNSQSGYKRSGSSDEH